MDLLKYFVGGLLIPLATCATIYQYNLVAKLNMGGIKGDVLFQQENDTEPLMIRVQFDSAEKTSNWDIHEYPIIYNSGASDSCSASITGVMISEGNLTARHGTFANKPSYSDVKLKAYGNSTLLGRSLVLYYPNGSIRACSTILPLNANVVYAAAIFRGSPVAGKIEFIQDAAKSGSPTVIFGELYYADGKTAASDNQGLYLSKNQVSTYGDCGKTIGNLSSIFKNIAIGIAGSTSRKFRIIDQNLPLSGSSKIVNRGLVIGDVSGSALACANIVLLGPMAAQASFTTSKHDGCSGSVSFTQSSPYHPTVITFDLAGLASKAKGIHVHLFPIPSPEPSNPCNAEYVSGHLNPYGVNTKSNYPSAASATLDRYEVGDISNRFGTLAGKTTANDVYNDFQMDMYGIYGILGRALVIHKNNGSRWICSNISPIGAKELSATANFSISSSDLDGTVQLKQYVLSNGVVTETTFVTDLSYKGNPSKTTPKHNWHVHVKPVGNDAFSSSGKCASVEGHYNPYSVSVVKPAYTNQCGPSYPFRCELGDISAKQAKYDIGGGKKYFLDENVPLFGTETVNGRSITFHTENGGSPRLACADLVPGTGAAKGSYEFKNVTDFRNTSDLIKQLSEVLSVTAWQIPYLKTSKGSKSTCTKAEFYIIDNTANQNAGYVAKLNKVVKESPDKLGKYKPCKEEKPSSASIATPSVFAILFFSLIFMFVFRK